MSRLKYFTDLILGKGFYIFIFFHLPDSSPSVLNGLHFIFHCVTVQAENIKKI